MKTQATHKKNKVENKLQKIYNDASYDFKVDNRSYFTKSINKALCNDNVVLQLTKKGYFRRNKSNFKYNLRIIINGKGKLFYLENFAPESICDAFAVVSQMEHVKELINTHQDAYKCDKCGGKGIIPVFMHVCKGVCFDCLGIGYKFHQK